MSGFYNDCMFAHLRLHSEFSVVDSTCRLDETLQAAAADGFDSFDAEFGAPAPAAPADAAFGGDFDAGFTSGVVHAPEPASTWDF